MILIPVQVKALREEVIRLQEKKKDYEIYFKESEKNVVEGENSKYVYNTLEVDDYNAVCERLIAYQRALIENEFIDSSDSNIIGVGSKFTILYDTNEQETYTLVQNLIGLERARLNKDRGYIPYNSNLGNAVIGKGIDEEFSYTFNLKGRKDAITIRGKIIDIIRNSKEDVHFIISRDESTKLSKRSKAYDITLSQYNLLKEEELRLNKVLAKLNKYNNKIMLGSIIGLQTKNNEIHKYTIVEKDNVDFTSEIDANSMMANNLFVKNLNDYFEGRYYYQLDGKRRNKFYSGKIVEIDNSLVSKNDIYHTFDEVVARLNIVDEILSKKEIVASPHDGMVGIGSKVSIMTFENGEIQNRRVEVIKKAVSTELSTDYIEASSRIGSAIIGLHNNETFSYCDSEGNSYSGIVYDINNNMEEELAKDPLTYQKKRRG